MDQFEKIKRYFHSRISISKVGCEATLARHNPIAMVQQPCFMNHLPFTNSHIKIEVKDHVPRFSHSTLAYRSRYCPEFLHLADNPCASRANASFP